MNPTRKSYPIDVSDGEWEFLLPYLTLMSEAVNLPTNRGHWVKGVYSPLEVHDGTTATHLPWQS